MTNPRKKIQPMTLENLTREIDRRGIDNRSESKGLALVNVLDHESYVKEHIPGSINIPKGKETEFSDRFAKDKEIVVYCASRSCDASPTVARTLAEHGFTDVRDFEAGMEGWKAHRMQLATGEEPGPKPGEVHSGPR